MKSKIKKGVVIIFVLIISLHLVLAANSFNQLISNSENWEDTFSTLEYANLKGVPGTFLVSTLDGNVVLNSMTKSNNIEVISSRKNPYVFNYPDLIRSKGFAGAQEVTTDSANIDLMSDLPEINNFIVVGDSYGYNAIAAVPYATLTKSWIFLANRQNIYQIDAILSKINNKKILVYGYVDREVTDTLSKYNPETINTGDKFQDNIEIVKKYSIVKPVKQVILTNGEFIEKEIMDGAEPVLFTGKENVPAPIAEYLKNSNISVGVLIGNDLVGAATNIRRDTGISVMVKFARGARAQTGGVAEVEGLDLFPLPTPFLNLTIYSIQYNKANSQLSITYKSSSNAPLYLKGTITLNSDQGKNRVGDLNPIFLAPGDFKTISYSIDIASSDNLTADISTLFGETSSSLDRILTGTLNVESIDILDKCKLSKDDVTAVKYNKQKQEFLIDIKNPIEVDCWVDLELNNINEGYTTKTLSPGVSNKILSKNSKEIVIKEPQTDSDLEKNSMIDLTVYSGERDTNLVYSFTEKYPLVIETFTLMTLVAVGLAIVIIILIIIIFFILKRRKKKDDDF